MFRPIAMHSLSSDHRFLIERARICGCFACEKVFSPASVVSWCAGRTGDKATALCPRCGVDAVIPCRGSLADVKADLWRMRRWWFSLPSTWRGVATPSGDGRDLPRLLAMAAEDYSDFSPGLEGASAWRALWSLLGGAESPSSGAIHAMPYIADIAVERQAEPSCVTPLLFVSRIERMRLACQQGSNCGLGEGESYRRSLVESARLCASSLTERWGALYAHDLAFLARAGAARKIRQGRRAVDWAARDWS